MTATDTVEDVRLDVDLDAEPGCEGRPFGGEDRRKCPSSENATHTAQWRPCRCDGPEPSMLIGPACIAATLAHRLYVCAGCQLVVHTRTALRLTPL